MEGNFREGFCEVGDGYWVVGADRVLADDLTIS